MSYKNSVTFLDQEPVATIQSNDLLELDGYAFSKEELISYAQHLPQRALINPENNVPFSATARETLYKIPEIVVEIEKNLIKQESSKTLISDDVIGNMVTMLNQIHEVGIDKAEDPRIPFLTFLDSRTIAEQEAVMNYQIKILRDSSTMIKDRSEFSEAQAAFGKKEETEQEISLTTRQALQGGGSMVPCVKTLQIYLWKFVTEINPELLSDIPVDMAKTAKKSGYQLEPKSPKHFASPSVSSSRLSSPTSTLASIGESSDDELSSDEEEEFDRGHNFPLSSR